jgi:5'-nucleotidase / UDP-sugar diphosphatase
MKKSLFLLFLTGFFLPVSAQTEKKIVILHTNDLHSRLQGFGPESSYTPLTINDDKTVGGFARIATVLKNEKEANKGITLVLDAGDFFMGTLFPEVEKETGFQLRLMKDMGYDALGLGNHEYEFGPGWLAAVIEKSRQKGEIPSILVGNSIFDRKDSADNGLKKLQQENVIQRKLIISRDGIKFGIFSILGKDAVRVAPEAAPVTFASRISFARKMVKELKNEKCDIIICLSHSGVSKEKNGEWGGEDVELARKVAGINIIISGHTHTKLDKPLIVNGIPIVQAGEFGQNVGRLSLIYSDGKLKVDDYKLIAIDDRIMGDKNINQLIDEQKARLSSDLLKPLGMQYDRPVTETDFVLEGNDVGNYTGSNLGPIVADAIQYYVNNHSIRGTDVSMTAAGMLFDRILPGIQTAPDLFRVVPLGSGKDNVPGYALSRLYITGKELKSVLEILQVAYKSSPGYYCYYSGIRVSYNPDKRIFKKIKKIEIIHPDGRISNVDFSRRNKSLYSITASSYMLKFIGIIKKMSFGLVNVVPKDFSGRPVRDMDEAVIDMDENKDGVQEGKEWLALIQFLESMKDTNGDGIPDIDRKYSVPVKTFFQDDSK